MFLTRPGVPCPTSRVLSTAWAPPLSSVSAALPLGPCPNTPAVLSKLPCSGPAFLPPERRCLCSPSPASPPLSWNDLESPAGSALAGPQRNRLLQGHWAVLRASGGLFLLLPLSLPHTGGRVRSAWSRSGPGPPGGRVLVGHPLCRCPHLLQALAWPWHRPVPFRLDSGPWQAPSRSCAGAKRRLYTDGPPTCALQVSPLF